MNYQRRLRFMTAKQKTAVTIIEQAHSKGRQAIIRLLYSLVPNWLMLVLIGLMSVSIPLHLPVVILVGLAIAFGFLVAYFGLLSTLQGWTFQSHGGRILLTGFAATAVGITFIMLGIWVIILAAAKI